MSNIDTKYHKGDTCRYTGVLCQEGWCIQCQLYPKINQVVEDLEDGLAHKLGEICPN